MSRPYRVKLPEPVTSVVSRRTQATVSSDDCVETRIELEKILPEPAMKEVVKEVALRSGWKQSECDPDELHKDAGEVEQTLDLGSMTVTTVAKAQATVKKEQALKVTALPDQIDNAKAEVAKKLEAKLESEVQAEAGRKKEELDKEVLGKLTQGQEARKKEVSELLLQVYAEALKKKAASMGQITSIKEGKTEDGGFELTIKITE